MRMQDYERQPPPHVVERNVRYAYVEADGFQVVEQIDPDTGKRQVGLTFDLAGAPVRFVFPVEDVETMDGLIRDMIAARNSVWPSPGGNHA